MPFQFRIFSAEGTGQSGAGGGPVTVDTTTLVPGGIVSPYQGQGVKYVYRKYFLNIVQFSDIDDGPIISNVVVSPITETTATITYVTNELTTTTVNYGVNLNYNYSVTSGGILTSGTHTVGLTGLLEGWTYYYKIDAYDVDSNLAFYAGSFNTIDVTAPTFSNINVSSITNSGSRVTWDTNEHSTSKVLYGIGNTNTHSLHNLARVLNHTVDLTGLTSGSTYTYRVVSIDNHLNSGQSPIRQFTTTADQGIPALVISSVQSGTITETEATVTYTTNNPANTLVLFSPVSGDLTGTVGGNITSVYDSVQTLAHTGTISSLVGSNTYYFKVKSVDVYGQEATYPAGNPYSLNTIDNSFPQIFFSGVTGAGGNVIVGFNTSESATGAVAYEIDLGVLTPGNLSQNSVSGPLGTEHQISFPASQNTPYLFQISATDPSSHQTFDIIRSYTTSDTTAPVISSLLSGVGATGAVFVWQTDELSTSVGRWGTTTDYLTDTDIGNYGLHVLQHNVRTYDLAPSTFYYYEISSVDVAGNAAYASGTFTTTALPVTDTVPPVISHIQSVATSNSANISWDTDEYSSTVVQYGEGSLDYSATGISGSFGGSAHNVNIGPLTSEAAIMFRVVSTDQAGNTATSATNTFDTLPEPSNSNFAPGQLVATIEWEVPANSTYGASFQGEYIPIRVNVPVFGDADLVLNWYTSDGAYVQREVVKRNHDGQPMIVEAIFPVRVINLPAAGQKHTVNILAQQQSSAISWAQYEVPSDLEVYMIMPDAGKTKASLITAENNIVVQMRGDSASPYMRTFRIYNRCRLVNPTNIYHPESTSIGVHSYVTYYNKNLFPDFYPQIDVRLNNAYMNIDPGAPSPRGLIYYQGIAINTPALAPDGVPLSITCENTEFSMNETPSAMVLVKPLAQMPPHPQPLGNGIYLGGSLSAYNALYANDTSNHGFFQGSALEFRLALYKTNDANSKAIMQEVAGLEYVAYCINAGPNVRSWSMVPSFSPLGVYCPTLNSNFKYGGRTGRDAYDYRGFLTWSNIRSNLRNGTYISDPLAGGSAGYINGNSAFGPIPVQYGPYRPAGDTDGGASGGFQIEPFAGFNHSKYSTLWMMQDHKMKLARHHQRMYSIGVLYNNDGQPASLTRWGLHPSNRPPNATAALSLSQMLNGGSAIGATNPCIWDLDNKLTSFNDRPNDGNTMAVPWNAPSVPVTENHLPGEGCSYHDDRTNYNVPYYSNSDNGRFHLSRFGVIDHAHQIRYTANLIAVTEMTNDMMMKDDLMMQGCVNQVSFAHLPMRDGYWNHYNMAEYYYGATRSNPAYSFPGILTLGNFGYPMGRVFGWPLYAMVAAYTLGTDRYRSEMVDTLKLHGKVFKDGSMPVGSLTRMNQNTNAIWIQHQGQHMNGVICYLRPDVESTYNGYGLVGYKLAGNANAGTSSIVNTSITAAEGFKLIDKFVTTVNIFDYNADSPFNYSLSVYAGQGIVFKINEVLTTWKASLWGAVIGAGTGQYRLQFFARDTNGNEFAIHNSSQTDGPIFSALASNSVWNIGQVNFSSIPNVEFAMPSNWTLVVKLYAKLVTGTSAVIRTYYNGLTPLMLTTTVEDVTRPYYDAAQVFETHISNLSHLANAKSVLKTVDSATATTIFGNIRGFYNKFFECPRADLSIPGVKANSSTWLRYSNGVGAEIWSIGVGGNVSNPTSDTQPISSFTNTVGKYSADSDSTNYVLWSTINGMVAEIELGQSFTLTLEPTISYSPGYLLHKWSVMGTPHATSQLHRDAIYQESQSTGFTQDQSWSRTSNASAVAGLIGYTEANPGVSALSNSTVVSRVKVYISQEGTPTRAEIASTSNISDIMTGPSVVNGDQTEALWTAENGGTTKLEFSRARGLNEAVTLYNRDGELGGNIEISSSVDASVPFWVRYRFDENTPTTEGSLRLGVIAGEGEVGGSSQAAPVDPPPPGTAAYFNPSGEICTYNGATAPGTNFLTIIGNKYYLSFFGADERVIYSMDFSAGSGNINGALRIYEVDSDSFPVYNAGLHYRDTAGSLYSPLSLTAICTRDYITSGTNSFTMGYTDAINGGRHKKYTVGISGKSLRVNMQCTDVNPLYSGNYYTASIGIATGVENPVFLEYDGNSCVPTCIFDGPFTKHYWSSYPDPTQSYSQEFQPPQPISATTGSNFFSNPYTLTYKQTTNGTIVNPVNETFNVTVAGLLKNVFPISTAPISPYYDAQKNLYMVMWAADITGQYDPRWTIGKNSYLNSVDFMYNVGMDNVGVYPYYWWSTISSSFSGSNITYGPDWFPAKDASNFASLVSRTKDLGYRIGGYTMFWSIENTSQYYNTEYLNVDQTGAYKKLPSNVTALNSYTLNYKPCLNIVDDQLNTLNDNYGWNAVHRDTETYSFPAPVADRLDQRYNTTNAKNVREGLIYHKLTLDAARLQVDGPMWGEGALASWSSDQQFFLHGYVDRTERSIPTNSNTSPADLVSGHQRAPTKYWEIVDYEWLVNAPKQVNGFTFYDRLLGPDDYDVMATQNGTFANSSFFAITTGAGDRWRSHAISRARGGSSISNGLQGNPGDYITQEQNVMDYYMTNALQTYMFNSPVQKIEYYHNNGFSGVDDILKATKDCRSFTGKFIHIETEDGLNIYVNHTPVNQVLVLNPVTYTIPRDGFVAYETKSNFIAFTASVVDDGEGKTTNGNVISYVKDPENYEFFHGRSHFDNWGDITTTGNNLHQMRLHNFRRDITVYGVTGVPDTIYPLCLIDPGLT